jgi:hypothetical protein
MTNDDRRIYRVASLTLVNAMLFQELISQREPVKTLRHTLESTDSVSEFNSQWKYIENNVNFVPIFKVARDILLTLPASPETDKALRRLAESAIKISNNRAALRHDLMGRIYHRLLADAKFFGAFYTKIPAATLLLKLAVGESDWPIDWSCPESIGKLRIADLACGTGTLLKAAMAAVVDKHIEDAVVKGLSVHPDEVHKNLIEKCLWGFDVLSSAVHLAAAAIAMHDPRVTVQGMHLYALPLGGRSRREIALGSIDFAKRVSNHGKPLHVQKTLIGASIGPEEATSKRKIATTLPLLNMCTMNPPFTRSVYGNFLFGGVGGVERRELQERLRDVLDEYEIEANITAGLGAVFVAVADRMMTKDGILALVLPKSVLNGTAWEPTRSIFRGCHLKYVICSHEPNNWNFSESTELSEVLLVLTRGPSSQTNQTKFINLWIQPKTNVEALAVAREVQRSRTPGDLTATTGTCEIRSGNKKFGEIVQLCLTQHEEVTWALPVSFAQTDLCRTAYHLSQGEVYSPGIGKAGNIKTKALSTVATLGPDGRDIYDGFSLADCETPYSAFWGHEAEESFQLSRTSNQYLNPLTEPLPGRHLRDANLLWSRAGTLMLPKELWLSTDRVAGVVLPSPALSNVWWPTRWLSEDQTERDAMERRLALWFNSTLGLFTLLMQRQETKGPWVKFPKAWYEQLQVLDLNSLSRGQKRALDELWTEVRDRQLLPFPQLRNDVTRKRIDEVFSQVLEIPLLDQLRDMLSREPLISMQLL